MTRNLKTGIAVFLALMLCLGLLPTAALARNNQEKALTISKTVTLPDVLTFAADDFSALVPETGGTLGSIQITGSNPAFGSLKLDNEDYTLGDSVPLASLEAGALTFAATGAGTVFYTVTAYAADDAATLLGTATLKITVKEACCTGTVCYITDADTPVAFRAEDFAGVFLEATGKTLSYVTLSIPSPDWGILYEGYRSSDDYDGVVTDQTNYYVEGTPALSDITFVPASGYTGSLTIAYTGYSADGLSLTGIISIKVGISSSCRFGDVDESHAWAAGAIDYLYENGIITGVKPGCYNPDASISRGDFMLMLCRAFALQADVSGNFSDVGEDSYYYNAIGIAKRLGIGKGCNGKFNPQASLSRQDAMVMLVRTMEVAGIPLAAGSESDLACFADRGKISDYAADAIAALVKAGIIQGNGGNLNPKASVSRAEMAVILYRVLTVGETT